jgi:hypothetical protein
VIGRGLVPGRWRLVEKVRKKSRRSAPDGRGLLQPQTERRGETGRNRERKSGRNKERNSGRKSGQRDAMPVPDMRWSGDSAELWTGSIPSLYAQQQT